MTALFVMLDSEMPPFQFYFGWARSNHVRSIVVVADEYVWSISVPANLQTSTPVSEETKLWDFRSFMILLMHNVSISSHLKSLKKVSECDREHRCNHGNPLSLICLQPHTAESCWLLTVCSLSVSSFDAVISHESVLDVWCETMWNVLIGRVSRVSVLKNVNPDNHPHFL